MKKLIDLHKNIKMPALGAVIRNVCEKNLILFAMVLAVVMAFVPVCENTFLAIEAQASESHPLRVVDEADLLTSVEEDELLAQVDEISERHQFDVVVVTVNSLDGEDIQYYAADYYDYNGYGMGENHDGAMFIMSMEEREWFILTTGYGIDVLEDYEIDSIGEKMVTDLSDGLYLDAFETFAEEVDFEVEYGVQEATPSILISIVAGLVLGLIPAFIMRGKLKSVKMQTSAGGYENKGSRNLSTKQDIFLYHTVNRVPKPKENSGGGSTTFKGSSGRSHGGRGGSF